MPLHHRFFENSRDIRRTNRLVEEALLRKPEERTVPARPGTSQLGIAQSDFEFPLDKFFDESVPKFVAAAFASWRALAHRDARQGRFRIAEGLRRFRLRHSRPFLTSGNLLLHRNPGLFQNVPNQILQRSHRLSLSRAIRPCFPLQRRFISSCSTGTAPF